MRTDPELNGFFVDALFPRTIYIRSIYSHSGNILLRITHITSKLYVYPASWRHVSVLPKAKDDQAS